MHQDTYHYLGMHIVWWLIWGSLLFWIFASPYTIPGQRSTKNSPLDILKKRFAAGEIDEEEYQKRKKILMD